MKCIVFLFNWEYYHGKNIYFYNFKNLKTFFIVKKH